MASSTDLPSFQIRPATKNDVPVIFSFIKKLADYERLTHEVVATEKILRETLFGRRRTAEVALGGATSEALTRASTGSSR